MERITQFFMRQRTLFWSLIGLMTVAGIVSYSSMPKLEDPVTYGRTAFVVVPYPGATAHEVELNVAKTMEDAISTLPDIADIYTTCQSGLAQFKVQFSRKLRMEDKEQHYDMLRRKTHDIQMSQPQGTYEPIVIDDMADVYGIIYALTGDGYTYEELQQYAKMLRVRLLQVEGVKRVNIAGSREQVVNITVSKERIAANGMLPLQIISALQSLGKPQGAGLYCSDGERIALKVSSPMTTLDDIRRLPLTSPLGGLVRLQDVTEDITIAYQTPQTNGFFVDGEPALAVCVAMEADAIVPNVGRKVEQQMQQIAQQMPVGFELQKIFFQPDQVNTAVNGFLWNLVASVAIVILVLVLFMGWRSGVIIGFGLILTILISFPILSIWGTTLQRMSLGAFIVAMGMLVDNAVVIMDGVMVDRKRGLPPEQYLYRTVRNTAMPLLGATIIAICAFLAIYISQGSVAEYASDLFRVICVSLFVSWILALVQVPVCADSWFPKKSKPSAVCVQPATTAANDSRFARFMERTITTVVANKAMSIGITVVLIAASLAGLIKVNNLFFPDFEYNQFVVECFWPEQTNADSVRSRLMDMTAILQQNEKVTRVTATQGSAPAHYCLVRPMTAGGSCYGELMVDFEDYNTLCEELPGIRESFRQRYPDAYIRFRKYSFSIETTHPIEVEFTGPDPAVLKQLSAQAEQIMRESEYVDAYSVQNDWRAAGKQLLVRIDDNAAAGAGITKGDVANALAAATTGMPVGILPQQDDHRIIYLQMRNADGSPISDLRQIPVWSMLNIRPDEINLQTLVMGGLDPFADRLFRAVPLSAVTDGMEMTWEEQIVHRHNGVRSIEVECDPDPLNPEATPASVKRDIAAKIEAIPLPPGYARCWLGQDVSTKESISQVLGNFVYAAMIIIVVLLLLFNSWKKIGMIICSLPFFVCGLVPTLLITGKPFTFMAMIGLLGLLGMMIKNLIVLIDEIDRLIGEGAAPFRAIVDATISRTRPVMMASITTIVGMLPLIPDPMYGSMAVAIMGGLAVGTVGTLVILPLLYATFFGIKSGQPASSLANKGSVALVALLMLLPLHASAQTDTLRLSLDQCREMAMTNSPDMRIGQNKVKQAEYMRRAVLANFFPQVKGTAMGFAMTDLHILDYEMVNLSLQMRGVYLAGFQLTQPIYAGGRLVNGYKLTKVGEEAAKEQQRMTDAQTIATVDNAYWTYVAVRSKVLLLDEYITLTDTLAGQVSAAVDVGMTTNADLLKVQAAQAELAYQHQRALNGLVMCRMHLCQLIGVDPDSLYVLPEENLPDMQTLLHPQRENMDNRPEFRLLDTQVKARKLQLKMTVGDYLPTLGLMLGYTWFGNMKLHTDINVNSVGRIPLPSPIGYEHSYEIKGNKPMALLSLSVPLTQWGEGAYKIKHAKLELENAKLESQKNKDLMSLEERNAWQMVESGQQMIAAADLALQAAVEQLRVARDRYEMRLTPLNDLLDAQTKWQQAESNSIEARTQYLIHLTEYRRVTGRLTE